MVVRIIKRDGAERDCDFQQIMTRLLDFGLGYSIDCQLIMKNITGQFPTEGFITTHEIDMMTMKILTDIYFETRNKDYEFVARKIFMSDLNHTVKSQFSQFVEHAYEIGLFHPAVRVFVQENSARLDKLCNTNLIKENLMNSVGMVQYYNTYLWKQPAINPVTGAREFTVIERPVYTFMRVALAVGLPSYLFQNIKPSDELTDEQIVFGHEAHHNTGVAKVAPEDLEGVFKNIEDAFEELVNHRISPPTPIVRSACMRDQRFTSCFIGVMGDSIERIFGEGGLDSYAQLSKGGGGIGVSVSRIRSDGALIDGTNGVSNGIFPWIKNAAVVANTVDQGGNGRKGSFAIYLEPWHADIEDFIQLQADGEGPRRVHGNIFPAIWVPDLFLERAFRNQEWSLLCPRDAPDLPLLFDNRVTGDLAFTRRYEEYERNPSVVKKKVSALSLLSSMVLAAMERSGPYMCAKDAANSYSNQVFTNYEIGPDKHVMRTPKKPWSVINSSNLCTEIYEVNSPGSIASCNLLSIILKNFVAPDHTLDREKLINTAKIAARMLNGAIDNNLYIGDITLKNNMNWRPMAIGVQGMATMFFKCGFEEYTSFDASNTMALAAECIYYGALSASNELARVRGAAHARFEETYYAKGLFHFDLFGQKFENGCLPRDVSEHRREILQLGLGRWEALQNKIVNGGGLLNSLFCAWMPTASSSIPYGSTENFEPFVTIIYNKKNKGEFLFYHEDPIEELMKLPRWPEIYDHLCNYHYLETLSDDIVPPALKRKYAAGCQYDQNKIISMIARAHAFVDQGISLNLHYQPNKRDEYTLKNVMGNIARAWQENHKTLLYYIRRNDLDARHKVYKRTATEIVEPSTKRIKEDGDDAAMMCLRENGPNCTACMS
jgi:ribonucleoside-diphosphate reductase alpha subunit